MIPQPEKSAGTGSWSPICRAKGPARRPPREQWLRRYPEFADELAQFFADADRFDGAVNDPTRTTDTRSAHSPPPETGKPPLGIHGNGGVRTTAIMQSFRPDLGTDRSSVSRFMARAGMGEIWLAEDTRVNQQVAFKRLREKRKEDRERFVVEAQIAGQPEQPSLVPLHDLEPDAEGRPFYVMKHVEGNTLKEAVLEHR